MKYAIGSLCILLALLTSGDMFIAIGASVFFLPTFLLLQWLTSVICKKTKRFKKYAGYASLTPSILVSVWIVGSVSIWVQPNQVFKVVLGRSMPTSIKNFHYTEEAWTDYMAKLYFDISPEDLQGILESRGFRKAGLSKEETINFDEMEWIAEPLEPIVDPIRYRYNIPENKEGRGGGSCDLFTNTEHNRAYVFYAVD